MSEWRNWMAKVVEEERERNREHERERERIAERERRELEEAAKEMLRIFAENEKERKEEK